MNINGDIIRLILGMIFLGVLIALSPTIYITELAILKKSSRPFLHIAALLTGVALSIAIFVYIFGTFIDPSSQVHIPRIMGTFKTLPLADLAIGALLIAAAIKLSRSAGVQIDKDPEKKSKVLSSSTLFWFGFIKTSTSFTSLAAIIFCARFLKAYYTNNTVTWVIAVGLLILVSLTPFIFLAALEKISPQKYKKTMELAGKAELLNWRLIVNWLLFLGGVYFLIIGLRALN